MDEKDPRANLDAVIASRGLLFGRDLDEAMRDDLRASWGQLARARGGSLSSADIEDTLRSYLRIGMLRRPAPDDSVPGQRPYEGLPDEVAELLATGAPERPTSTGGDAGEGTTHAQGGGLASSNPFPTMLRLAVPHADSPIDSPKAGCATKERISGIGGPSPRRAVLYGSLSYEFGTYAFEQQGGDGGLRVLPVADVDPRFFRLVDTLARRHVALVALAEAAGGSSLLEVWDLRAVSEVPKGDSLQTMSPGLLELMLRRLRSLPRPKRDQQRGTNAQMGHATRETPESAPKAPSTLGTPSSPDASAARRPQRASLSGLDDISSYLSCMEDTLPQNIRSWAWQNLELAQNDSASKEERRHASRALSLVLSIQWGARPFRRVDPARARQLLDRQLFGLDAVKQRVVETVVQINRTHTLPLYGLLLAGPAGVGKSQIAYAAAHILDLPWASLDMSAIRDLAALIGSDRVYSNAKPGRVMEALAQAGSANMVLVLNELDKADEGGQGGSSADALLTLFDNLGFTDNYVECSIPTDGIYPIATANDLSRIGGPLLSRFEVIEIPDYTPDEKRTIFTDFSLPKVLGRLGMADGELSLTDAAVNCVVERYRDETGCRSLEKAADHLAAHALFLLESDPTRRSVTFGASDVRQILDA